MCERKERKQLCVLLMGGETVLPETAWLALGLWEGTAGV